jgi:phosphatidylglycerophosphatase A
VNAVKKLLVTGLGTGYLPVAPGTWGSAVPAAVFLLVCILTAGDYAAVLVTMAGVFLVSCVVCVTLGRFTEKTYGRKDPGQCVIDEYAGQSAALMFLPLSVAGTGDLAGWIILAGAGFLAFRFFDIVKPPPARQMEKLPAGWGVLLDDVVAGIFANVTLRVGLLVVQQMGG